MLQAYLIDQIPDLAWEVLEGRQITILHLRVNRIQGRLAFWSDEKSVVRLWSGRDGKRFQACGNNRVVQKGRD